MPTARIRSALSRIPLGRALIALGLVLVAINIAAAIWDVRKARDLTERRAQRDFSNMTRLVAEQTAASLETVDLILRGLNTKSAKELALVEPKLSDALPRFPYIASLTVLDAHGRVLARSAQAPDFDGDMPERPYYLAHRERPGDDAPFLSDPYRVLP